MKVLIVDDEVNIRSTMSKFFAIEDIEKHLEETSCVRVHRSDIIKIMHALVEYGLIKELSPNIYHRFTL